MAIKICLDAGHYGKYNRSPAIPEYYESEMNWKFHLLLKKYLEQYGIEVITTRADPEKDLGLESRGRISEGCDLFLSIHSNAVGSSAGSDGMNESVDYVAAYVMLDGSTTVLGEKLAACVTEVMDTKQSPHVKTRKGNNGEYYGVLRGAAAVGTPGIILEHSFHTNSRSVRWLLKASNLDIMAQAEAKVIAQHFLSVHFKEVPEKKTIYRVQTGAFFQLENAERHLTKVKEAGFTDAFIAVGEV